MGLNGCLHLQSEITAPDGTKLKLPKDFHADVVSIEKRTNGTYSINLTNVTAKMNPAVITAQTAHDMGLIKATAEGVGAVIMAAPK